MVQTSDHSCDLLFGLLALQNGLIDPAQLVAAFQSWVRDKARPLADHLVGSGYLEPAHRRLLEGLVAAHVARHGGSADRSLAAISVGRSTREMLLGLGDSDVRATVDRVGGDLETTRDGESDRTGADAVRPAIGDGHRFRVVRPHARGGLGEVFVAVDSELHREVALKQILDRHADDSACRRRFVVEAEITGGLEHPGVVPVYGLGTYADGRPYYAMRFIRGGSLQDAIKHFHADRSLEDDPGRRSLELRQLLRRFVDVCNVIEFAHSRGVIHRDLKPANVVLGDYGETLVIDWGLAKATGRSEHDREERTFVAVAAGSSETMPGSVMGTPAYMSPEQAAGDHDRIGGRSDVYCLGATLYCLIAGRPPFEGDDVVTVLRNVQRGDFPPPRAVAPAIDRALEAICLKAMACEPQDRYRSPKALVEDIERWLADEPVSSYREPGSVRVRRWMRRHRTTVVTSAWLVVASLIGLSAGVVLLRAKQRETEAARSAAVENYRSAVAARQAAESARQEAESARQEAEANFARAMDAVETMLVRVGQKHLANLPHFAPVRRRLLEDALGFYRDFLARPGTSPDSLLQAARAYRFAGDIHRKLGQRDRARQELGKSLELLGQIPGGSRRALEQAAVHRNLGAVESDELRIPGAIDEYRRGLSLLAAHRDDDPQPRASRVSLSLEADLQSALGAVLGPAFRLDEGHQALRQARLALGRLIAAEPEDEDHRYRLSTVEHNEAILEYRRNDLSAAVERWRDAIHILDGLLETTPGMVHYRRDLGNSTMRQGIALAQLGRFTEAVEAGRRAVAVYERLAADYPTVWAYHFQAAAAHHNLAFTFGLKGDVASAEAEFRGSIDSLGILRRREPDNPLYLRDLANSHMVLGNVLAGARRFDDSSREISRARDLFAEAARLRPNDADIAFQAAAAEHNRAESEMAAGHLDEAAEGFHQSQVRLERLIANSPGSPAHLRDLANSTVSMGYCLLARGERVRAEAQLARALKLWDDLLARASPGDEYRAQRARTLVLLGRYDEAVQAAELLASRTDDDGKHAYDAACALAFDLPLSGPDPLAAARIPTGRAGGIADRAMGLLVLAARRGYATREQIHKDLELDALRDRADFPKLLDLILDHRFPDDAFAR